MTELPDITADRSPQQPDRLQAELSRIVNLSLNSERGLRSMKTQAAIGRDLAFDLALPMRGTENPLLNYNKYPAQYIYPIRNRVEPSYPADEDSTPLEIRNARFASFAIALETAAQIAEVELTPETKQCLSDYSVSILYQILIKAEGLSAYLFNENSDKLYEIYRTIYENRAHSDDGTDLKQWAKNQFETAKVKLKKNYRITLPQSTKPHYLK